MPLHWRRPPRGVPRIAERKTEGRYDRRLGQSLVRPFRQHSFGYGRTVAC